MWKMVIGVLAVAVLASTAPAEAHCRLWHPGHCVKAAMETRLLADAKRALLDAGLTEAEVAGLTVQDIDAQPGAIAIKSRVVYVSNDGLRTLTDWIAIRGTEPGLSSAPSNP